MDYHDRQRVILKADRFAPGNPPDRDRKKEQEDDDANA